MNDWELFFLLFLFIFILIIIVLVYVTCYATRFQPPTFILQYNTDTSINVYVSEPEITETFGSTVRKIPVRKYMVTYSTNSDMSNSKITASTSPFFTIQDLQNRRYYFTVSVEDEQFATRKSPFTNSIIPATVQPPIIESLAVVDTSAGDYKQIGVEVRLPSGVNPSLITIWWDFNEKVNLGSFSQNFNNCVTTTASTCTFTIPQLNSLNSGFSTGGKIWVTATYNGEQSDQESENTSPMAEIKSILIS